MTATVELTLTGPMDQLRIAWQTGETLLEAVPFTDDPEGVRYNTLLAIQEMVTNVLRHAYHCDESKPVRLIFTADDAGFSICLMDQGEKFDPRGHMVAAPSEDEFPTDMGGYGIFIASMVMDSIEYRWDGTWNILTMTKLVHSPVTTESKSKG